LSFELVVGQCQQRHTRRIDPQRTRTQTNSLEAMRLEQRQLVFVPAALRTNRDQNSSIAPGDRVTKRHGAARIRDEPYRISGDAIEVVFDQHFEPTMDRDCRQSGVACLLESLDEERTVTRVGEHVCVEVMTFDPFGVGENDLVYAERGQLRPQPAHHLWPRQREQQIDPRPRWCRGVENARQRHTAVGRRDYRSHSERPFEQTHSDDRPRHDTQHLEEMGGPCVREHELLRADAIVLVEQDDVHARNDGRLARRQHLLQIAHESIGDLALTTARHHAEHQTPVASLARPHHNRFVAIHETH
jgi:hypothetical protein